MVKNLEGDGNLSTSLDRICWGALGNQCIFYSGAHRAIQETKIRTSLLTIFGQKTISGRNNLLEHKGRGLVEAPFNRKKRTLTDWPTACSVIFFRQAHNVRS